LRQSGLVNFHITEDRLVQSNFYLLRRKVNFNSTGMTTDFL